MKTHHFERFADLLEPNRSKIVFFVLDGLGGLPEKKGGPTELEASRTPQLDALAAEGMCGLHIPVAAGITPGSGPGHLGLFGYDPLTFIIGRGVLAAAGIGVDLNSGDVAARGNFCTVDRDGKVTDRRAGRIDTETNQRLCDILRQIELEDVQLQVETIKEHRFLLVLRGDGLSDRLGDTDPQDTGVDPLSCRAHAPEAEDTADKVNAFVAEAGRRLKAENQANMVLLRGFASPPDWPQFPDVFGLRAAAIAGYPMYRGLASLLGMTVLAQADSLDDAVASAKDHWENFDFFFIHHKPTDSRGEDGAFDEKVRAIEEADQVIPRLLELEPDVLVVTGDHSTPSALASHSWHPVPALLWSARCRPDPVERFGERSCMAGSMGTRFAATELMPLALAHALRLGKFGA